MKLKKIMGGAGASVAWAWLVAPLLAAPAGVPPPPRPGAAARAPPARASAAAAWRPAGLHPPVRIHHRA